MDRRVVIGVVLAAGVWHALAVAGAWESALRVPHGNDFASYFYAVEVAAGGGDPYDTAALSAAARADGTRRAVHPFFYPPPFLLGMAWASPLDLVSAYRAWFWLDELCALLAGLVLWRWWGPLGAGVAVAAAFATLSAVPNNHVMGQVNLPVLALVLGGLWAADRDRPWLGGILVGAACMAKMSPALFVAWWLLRRRFRAVAAACATAVALSVLALPLVGPAEQVRFYGEVLPGFGSGDYNGLRVPIALFGNHSIPDVWHRLLPGEADVLGPVARALSTATALGLLVLLALAFHEALPWGRRPACPPGSRGQAGRLPHGTLVEAGQVGAVGLGMLLLPVYTYEHHLVWAIPAMVAAAVAVGSGRLGAGWAVPVGLGWIGLAFPLVVLKQAWLGVRDTALLDWALRDLKLLAILLLLAPCLAIGSGYLRRGER